MKTNRIDWREQLPAAFHELPKECQAAQIHADFPELFWVADLAPKVAAIAYTRPVSSNWWSLSKKQCAQANMLKTWERLGKMGYIPTRKDNYDAWRQRMGL